MFRLLKPMPFFRLLAIARAVLHAHDHARRLNAAGVRQSEGVPSSDIETRDDCERLVRAFYGRALEDPIIGFLFTDVAKLDLEAHVPRITSFWETVLLGNPTYGGGAFRPHAALHMKAPLRRAHFDQWVNLWTRTVDELFAGPTAELAKAHARRVARAFHQRVESIPSPAGSDGLVVTVRRRA